MQQSEPTYRPRPAPRCQPRGLGSTVVATPEIPAAVLVVGAGAGAAHPHRHPLRHRSRYPDAAAIDDGTSQLTYAELIADIEESVELAGGAGYRPRRPDRHPDAVGQLRPVRRDPVDPGRRRGLRPGGRRRSRRAGRAGVRRGRCGRHHHRGGPDPRSGFLTRLARHRHRWAATTRGSSSPRARRAPPRALR